MEPFTTTNPHPTMKFSQLLNQRDVLLRQARLANVAFAYEWLRTFAARVRRAGLQGGVTLRDGDPAAGLPWPTLTAETGSQAVIEEHFLEEDIVELADIVAFLNDGKRPEELSFQLEDIGEHVIPGLRRELAEAGVLPNGPAAAVEDAG